MIKLSGYKNWNELIYNCGYEVQGQNFNSTVVVQKKETKYNVTTVFKNDIDEEQIKEVNENLQSFIECKEAENQ